nr:hypothetical protein [Paenibacillus sp. BIC5C1]
MTRSRVHENGTPGELAALYYAQRATMELLITEGTQPSGDGQKGVKKSVDGSL